MNGYVNGKHDEPTDTQDRLVRVGTKYQASAPAVGDGDNVYLLVDAAGRPLIAGPAAHDAAAVGNPVRIGGVHRTTIPAVADLDAADFLVDAAGRLITVDYAIHQSRIGNGKFNQAELAKTTASEEEIAAWTVTNGKTGYLK